VTSFGYDDLGRKIWQQDANRHTTRFGYDERGRQVWRSLPGGQVESSTYNDGGQLESSTDFRGYVTTYSYDLRGRMVLKAPDARLRGAGEQALAWSYPDENTRVAMRGSVTTTYRSSPQRGWLQSVTLNRGGTSADEVVSYSYDDGGQKRSVSTTQGTSLYDYDAQGRLWHVSDQAAGATSPSLLASYGYDPVGNLSGLVRGNGVRTRYAFDELNRLTDLVHERATVGGSTTAGAPEELSRFHYTVRDDGKRTGLNESVTNNTAATPGALPVTTRGVSYGYDNAGRLTGEIGTDGRGVSYRSDWGLDNVGNRTASTYQFATAGDPGTLSSSSTIGATFNANDWLTGQTTTNNGGATGTQSWSYDANGAELTHGYGTAAPQQNGWGFDGRLLGTGTQGAATGGTGYETDASGNRLSVTLHQGQPEQKTTKYLLDENTSYAQVLEERAPDTNDSAASTLQARYVWGGGLAPLAMWRKGTDGQWRMFYFLADGQESVRQLSDGQGTVTDSYFYDAWGNPLAGGSGTTANPFRYTGQMLDASGKYFLRARYYDPATGRFLSHDPVMGSESDPISLHRYLYAGADAVNAADPSGRETLAEVQTTISSQLITAANYTTKVINIYEKVDSFFSAIQRAQDIFKVFRDPASIDALLESLKSFPSAFKDYEGVALNITGRDVLDSLEENLPEVIAHGIGPWSTGLAKSYMKGNKIQAFQIYMPNPVSTPATYTLQTPVKIDGIPIELVFGGKGGTRIVGMGIRTSQANQLFRVDFGLLNPNHGHGQNPTGDVIPSSGGAMRQPREIAAWNDGIFHYHVLGLGQ